VATDNPRPQTVRANRRVRKQSVALHKQWLQSSVNAQRQQTQFVRRQSATVNNPRPQTGHERNLSATVARQRLIRVPELSCPHGLRPISRFSSKSFRPMNTFDPAEVRKAVAEFTPRRPQKFQDLVPAKEVIVELRQKGGSYRSIAELLTIHCLPTSKTAIAMFCHQVLGENIRPRKRPTRKRPPASALANGGAATTDSTPAGESSTPAEPLPNSDGGETSLARSRGPRIAQVRKLNPQSNEKTDSHP